MKQYGQAEYAWYLIEQYIDNNMPMLTATQKEQLKRICREVEHSDTEVLVDIYADEGITGTSERREDFQRMIRDCRKGRIDRIYT